MCSSSFWLCSILLYYCTTVLLYYCTSYISAIELLSFHTADQHCTNLYCWILPIFKVPRFCATLVCAWYCVTLCVVFQCRMVGCIVAVSSVLLCTAQHCVVSWYTVLHLLVLLYIVVSYNALCPRLFCIVLDFFAYSLRCSAFVVYFVLLLVQCSAMHFAPFYMQVKLLYLWLISRRGAQHDAIYCFVVLHHVVLLLS